VVVAVAGRARKIMAVVMAAATAAVMAVAIAAAMAVVQVVVRVGVAVHPLAQLVIPIRYLRMDCLMVVTRSLRAE